MAVLLEDDQELRKEQVMLRVLSYLLLQPDEEIPKQVVELFSAVDDAEFFFKPGQVRVEQGQIFPGIREQDESLR